MDVHCHVPGGLVLQLTETVNDEFGYSVNRRTGKTVNLAFGANTGVDGEFMTKWLEQYARTPLAIHVMPLPERTV